MRNFEQFMRSVKQILDSAANAKGYSEAGADGPNPLYEMVKDIAKGDGHALGEIIYKVIRYARVKDEKDIIKVAAWAFLVWRSDGKEVAKTEFLSSEMGMAPVERRRDSDVTFSSKVGHSLVSNILRSQDDVLKEIQAVADGKATLEHPTEHYFTILSEEVGEVAREILNAYKSPTGHNNLLYRELIQVAATATIMAANARIML